MASRYTVMIRSICEQQAGLYHPDEYPNVEQIIQNSRDKIFDFDFPIYDEEYRPVLESNILRHYYFSEIGAETYGQWKVMLHARLIEIMPKYNAMYKATLLDFDPLLDTNYRKEGYRKEHGINENANVHTDITSRNDDFSTTNNTTRTDNLKEIGNTTASGKSTATNGTTDKYSDTPQGSLQWIDVTNNSYLTNARVTDTNGNNTYNDTTNTTRSNTGTQNTETTGTNTGTQTTGNIQNNGITDTTADYWETIKGYTSSPIDRIFKYIEIFQNIDAMIIKDLKPLFMGLWQ